MYGSLVVAGFRVAIRVGPICEEPLLRGILVVLEGVKVALVSTTESGLQKCAKPWSGGAWSSRP